MIISMDDYRRIDCEYDSGADSDRRRTYDNYGSPARARQFASMAPGARDNLDLPDEFDDFNAREFVERAYGLATQI